MSLGRGWVPLCIRAIGTIELEPPAAGHELTVRFDSRGIVRKIQTIISGLNCKHRPSFNRVCHDLRFYHEWITPPQFCLRLL